MAKQAQVKTFQRCSVTTMLRYKEDKNYQMELLTLTKETIIILIKRFEVASMKEKALELLKRKVYLSDVCDDLTPEEEVELCELEKSFEHIKAGLSDEEKNWLYAGFAGWYDKFMDMETKMFIKPRGG